MKTKFKMTTYQRNRHGGFDEVPFKEAILICGNPKKYRPYLVIPRGLGQMDLQIANTRTLESLARNILKALGK